MNLRELLRASLDVTKDLDQEVKVRVVYRDDNGVVTHQMLVPVARWWTTSSTGPCIVVEEKHLLAAEKMAT